MTAPDQPVVLCLDCERPVTNPKARARRIGSKCWRERRRAARQMAPTVLPGMSSRCGGQSGPGLLTANESEAGRPTAAPTTATGPGPDEQVWIATARRDITAHRPATASSTGCGRSTRTGLTLPAGQATERYHARWCVRCWPAGSPR